MRFIYNYTREINRMQALLLPVLKVLGSVLMGLFTALMSEAFLKKALVLGLEKLVKRTESDIDDKLLVEAKKAWGME
jgi:hypothetical protein